MPDDALNITLSDDTASKLAEKAKAIGVSPEALAATLLEQALVESERWASSPHGIAESKPEWVEDNLPEPPKTQPEDYGGPYVDLDEALDNFSSELNRRLTSRAG